MSADHFRISLLLKTHENLSEEEVLNQFESWLTSRSWGCTWCEVESTNDDFDPLASSGDKDISS